MKTSILTTAGIAFIACLMNGFVAKAQETLCSTIRVNERVVLQDKYVMGSEGIRVKGSEAKYTYDENGDLLKKEVFVWNPTRERNNKTGRYALDYSKGTWTPQYCILQKKDLISNFVCLEMHLWNQKEKAYDDAPVETMISHLDDSNTYNYLVIQKGGKYIEVINNIDQDKTLLADLTK